MRQIDMICYNNDPLAVDGDFLPIVWTATINVYNHKPIFTFTDPAWYQMMWNNGYQHSGELLSRTGFWYVPFGPLEGEEGEGEPALMHFSWIRFREQEEQKSPFEVPKRRNYKLPPGWHTASFTEYWLRGLKRTDVGRYMRVRELRI